jgi:hypothetical protein
MVLRAGFKKKLRLYVELKIYGKNRRKITGPQCVKFVMSARLPACISTPHFRRVSVKFDFWGTCMKICR